VPSYRTAKPERDTALGNGVVVRKSLTALQYLKSIPFMYWCHGKDGPHRNTITDNDTALCFGVMGRMELTALQ